MDNSKLLRLQKKPNDNIYTPPKLAEKLISFIEINEEDVLLDGFKGEGAFFDNFPKENKKYYCEIEEGIDFFSFNNKVDWSISNPPFSIMRKLIKHSSFICQKGFAYVMPLMSFKYGTLKFINEAGFYIEKFILFDNPKEWNLGFPHAFIIFTKNKNDSIILCDKIQSIQKKLY